jgi:hypothetical protein
MPPSRSFFDQTLLEQWGAAFIREDKVDEALERLIPNSHITKGSFSCPGHTEPRDLVWNHMDQNHRPLIHRTYGEAMRVFIGERGAFSLTRFGNWPAVIPVFDGHFRENGFYQVLCIFGLVVIVNVIECQETPEGTRMDIGWAIASHRLLRFLHPILDRRLRRLNVVQNREDEVMRRRRTELRAAGYRFATDQPDFVNSNAKTNNVVFPALAVPQSISLEGLQEGQTKRIEVANRAYVVRRAGDGIEVWPGVCLHEGAALTAEHVDGSIIRCPWHGLALSKRRLGPGQPEIMLCGARLSLAGDRVSISPE